MRPLIRGYTHTDDPACDKPLDDEHTTEQPAPWHETRGLTHTQKEGENK